MTPLLNCNERDFNMYYGDTFAIHDGQAIRIIGQASETTVVVESLDGNRIRVPKKSIQVFFPPAFYSTHSWCGIRCSRSYKRAPQLGCNLQDFQAVYEGREINPYNPEIQSGCIGPEFRIVRTSHARRRPSVIEHRGDRVGFVKDNTFYVQDAVVADRLNQIMQEKGYEYIVVQE